MQIFDEQRPEERKKEVCRDFFKTRKNNEWLKKLLTLSKKPFTPWTMVFPDPPTSSPLRLSLNSFLFLNSCLISNWPPHLQASPHTAPSRGFRDHLGVKTVLTFCLYSLELGSWLVTFTISIDQNISETALLSISVISHKYLTIHLNSNQDSGHNPVRLLKIVITVFLTSLKSV